MGQGADALALTEGEMNITKEQWQKIISILLSAAIAVAAVVGWDIGLRPLVFPKAGGVVIGSQALRERIGLDTPVDSWFFNGADIRMYSDNHSTQKIWLDGGVGDLTLARTLTVTNLISQSVGFNASGQIVATAGITISQGVTSNGTLNMVNNVISNIGNASTDFDTGGGLTTAGNVSVTGYISVTGASSYMGTLYNSWPVLVKTSTYPLTVMDRGAMVVNTGASADITITLPSAASGLYYCVGIGAAKTITIAVTSGDAILGLTNAADNRIQNAGTVGDSVCLLGIDTTNWLPVGDARGTWTDVD